MESHANLSTIEDNQLSKDNENGDFKDGSILRRIISVRSEKSIFAEISQQIKQFSNSNVSESLANTSKTNSVTDKAALADQVRLGELTPFQASVEAAQKQNNGGTFNKTTQLLDLEQYIFQQAELARRKAKLPCKNKRNLVGREKNVSSYKRQKVVKTSTSRDNTQKINCKQKQSQAVTVNIDSENDKTTCKPVCCNDVTKAADIVSPSRSRLSINQSNAVIDMPETSDQSVDVKTENISINHKDSDSGSEYLPSDEHPDSADEGKIPRAKRTVCNIKSKTGYSKSLLDDGDENVYRQRVERSGYSKNLRLHKVDNLFKVPMPIWKRLYKYQKVSVQWLWELHGRNLGGLLGDEMGLGKTVQLIAFLAGLDCSELLLDGGRFRGLGPTLIVCPATLLEQWVEHFHEWWPILRVATLHHMGTYKGDPEDLVHSLKCGGILVTSYTGVLTHEELLINMDWHYIILDEGHKIRNPEAKVTKAVKKFSTPHRIILTGSPMQNSLKELWSLFDFILPGKLGTLPAFMEHFAAPITRGGYTNASALQEATALNVATMLNDAITPYMLRRTKNDVQHHVSLPDKNEQVLFCSLTEEQRTLYKSYLRSGDVSFVLHEKTKSGENGRYRARLLVALTALRKICNHPDLHLCDHLMDAEEYNSEEEPEITEADIENFGCWKRAGKMAVVRSLLKIWKKQGHRVLLFTQSRQMLAVLEILIQRENYSYLRMDGTTPMSQRQQDVCKFNKDTSYFVFILTTRVGGLGINLTGANRVIIYDPDWNPATDAQARERAWRIGQEKNVTIYRLITAGTIEEKIYHRQIFKQLLSNKVLEDPRQRRLFRTSDLTELFSLNEPIGGDQTESEKLFSSSKLSLDKPKFSSDKVQAMRKLAAKLSKSICKKTNGSSSETNDRTNKTSQANKTAEMNEETVNTSKNGDITRLNQYLTSDVEKNFKENSEDQNCNNAISNVGLDTQAMDDKDDLSSVNVMDKNEGHEREETNAKVELEVIVPKDIHEITNLVENTDIDMKSTDKPLIETEFDSRDNGSTTQLPNTVYTVDSIRNNCNTSTDLNSDLETESKANFNETITSDTIMDKNKKPVLSVYKSKERRSKHALKRKKKHSRKKEDRTISSLFEGERISYLVGRRLGNSQVEEFPSSDDNYVLQKLFAKSTVSTAFQHERIISGVRRDDSNLMQRQASKTAEESMELLRKSRKWCRKPAWNRNPCSAD